ncbi:phage tail tape measure protein [Pedobacter antarcticus]|uniref:phage tail tape measure protein n=1 Tax=Pedobacter antarcticus TaxID=34086 RepID=UPI000882B454|nr:phage tail tape measure protein [Pedobacter antarcticus]SDM41025.1 phage tail tape measure protein, TP901 family, core region [Pedobacter antarcticus]
MAGESPRSIKATLYIDGKPVENTFKNLTQVVRAQRRELDGLVIGSEAYNKSMDKLQLHQKRLQAIKDEIKGLSGGFSLLAAEIQKLGQLAVGYLGFDFITDKFQNIILNNAKLSDSLADVRKTTGLSEEAVRRLYTELGKINTRSSREELTGLAVVAGKLGVAGERDILGFVRAADKIKVALGEDLGDAEAAVNSLGKLVDLFKIKDVFGLEDSLIKVGSAINAVGAAGTAKESYMVEFTNRLGGIAPQANMSIQSILGLAATMDELGQPLEASATAIGQFIVGLGKDIPGFARIAGLSVKDFTKILKTDGNQALLEVLKNLQSTGMGVAGLAEKMGLVGEEGARAVSALGALSNNLDKLVTKQKLANEEFALGTSLQQEFDVKMASLAATTDLLVKEFDALATNPVIMDFLKNMVFEFSQFLDVMKKNSVMIVNITKLLIVGAVTWGAYATGIFLVNTALEANILRTILARNAAIAFAGIQALLTGNLTRAAAAMRALNIATAANPFAAVLAVVVALGTAMALYSKSTSAAQRSQEDFNAIDAAAKSKQMEEIDRIKALNAILINETSTREKKLAAIKKLREVMPAALKHLTEEEALTTKGTIAISKYVQALEKKSIAEAAQAQINKLRQKNIEIESGNQDETSIWQDAGSLLTNGTYAAFKKSKAQKGKNNAKAEMDENVRRIKTIQDRYKEELSDTSSLLSVGDLTTGGVSTGGLTEKKKTGKSKEQIAKEQALKEFEKLDEQYKKLNLQRLDDQLSANEKEVSQEAQKYNALIKQETDFLKFKGITAEQKKITEQKISSLESDKQTAVNNLRIRQETEMLESIAQLRTSLADVHESELVKQTNQINKFYDQQEKKNIGNDKNLAALKNARAKELSDAELREKERLEKEKLEIASRYDTVSGNKRENKLAAINKRYDDELFALREKYGKEIQLKREYQDAINLIEKNRKGETDQFKLKELQTERDFVIQMAQQASDATFNIIANNQRAQTEKRLAGIENERKAELSKKDLTEKQKEQINEKYDKKVKEEKLKGWKAQQAADLAQAVVNGALAITKVLAQTGILSPFAIPAIAAATAIQTAVIMATPAPQFAAGGFSDEDPEGFVGQSTLFKNSASGRPFEAGEAGKEWIAPNWMVTSPRYANLINMLEVARKEKRSYASGGYNGDQPRSNPVTEFDFSNLESLMQTMIDAQNKVNAQPIQFIYSDYKDFENEMKRIEFSQKG